VSGLVYNMRHQLYQNLLLPCTHSRRIQHSLTQMHDSLCTTHSQLRGPPIFWVACAGQRMDFQQPTCRYLKHTSTRYPTDAATPILKSCCNIPKTHPVITLVLRGVYACAAPAAESHVPTDGSTYSRSINWHEWRSHIHTCAQKRTCP
jgi:hypothetical protein